MQNTTICAITFLKKTCSVKFVKPRKPLKWFSVLPKEFHRTLYFINLVSLNNCPSSILSTQLAINVSVLCSCHAEDAASA